MPEQIIQQLLRQGKLRQQAAGTVQVEALLRQAILDLSEARKICEIAERATYVLAYMAMLKAGRALLLHHGLVPDDGAQHKTVVEVTAAFLGPAFKNITLHFENMRRKRNEMTYEAGALLSLSEAQKAFADAVSLIHTIMVQVKKDNPQLELNFEPKQFIK
jgi:uncharacterized protein (UPF0332 family)